MIIISLGQLLKEKHINGFIEVYNDPLGYRGSYEGIVQIKDFDMFKKWKRFLKNSGLKIISINGTT
jgi:hypothetical protein